MAPEGPMWAQSHHSKAPYEGKRPHTPGPLKKGAWGGPYGQRRGFLHAKKIHGNSPHGLAFFL